MNKLICLYGISFYTLCAFVYITLRLHYRPTFTVDLSIHTSAGAATGSIFS